MYVGVNSMNIEFDEEQQKIIEDSKNNNILIKAVAGSGKTTVLLEIINRFLKSSRDVKESLKRILVLTFSDSAATEFRGRLREILKKNYNIIDELTNVTTIHAFSLKIISEYSTLKGFNININVEDEININLLRKKAWQYVNQNILKDDINLKYKFFYKKITLHKINSYDFSLENLLFYIYTYQKRFGYTDINMDIIFKKFELSEEEKKLLKDMYFEYKKHLDDLKIREGAIDYDDILYFANEILKDVEYGNYELIIVDEVQDTSYIQLEIIKNISKNSRLIMAGDYMQSIYEWRDAEPDYVETIAKELNLNPYHMDKNFRSNEIIINFVNELFNSLKNKYPQIEKNFHNLKVYENNKGNGKIILKLFTSDVNDKTKKSRRKKEADYIKEVIENLVKNGAKYEDIAILFRSKTHIMEYAEVLRSSNIKYSVIVEKSLLEDLEIKIIMNLLYLIYYYYNEYNADIRNKLEFIEIVLFLYNCSVEDKCEKEKDKLEEFIRDSGKYVDKIKKIELVKNFDNKFNYSKRILNSDNYLDKIIRYRRFLSILQKIEETETKKLVDFINIINQYSDQKFNIVSLNENYEKGVKLISIHQSKGLEFPIVILADTEFKSPGSRELYLHRIHGLGISKGLIMNKKFLDIIEKEIKEKELIENLRVLYVALTRARNLLIIPLHDYNKKDNKNEENRFKSYNEIILDNIDINKYPYDENFKFSSVKNENLNIEQINLGDSYKIKREKIYLSVEDLARFIFCPEKFQYYEDKGTDDINEFSLEGSMMHANIRYKNIDEIIDNLNFNTDEKNFLKEKCKDIKYEYPILFYYKGLLISGKIDALCKDVLLEFKTGEEREEDLLQVKIYLYLISKIFNYKNVIGFIIYLKNNLVKKIYYEDIENEIEKYVKKDYKTNENKCDLCDLRKICEFNINRKI
jgi:ATP-dependent exoDNAse (exonuclease V) beta subunit